MAGKTAHEDLYEKYRFKIQNENELIHNRLSWFVTLQSFLFTSLGLLSNSEFFRQDGALVAAGIAVVGLASAGLAYLSVSAANTAITAARSDWEGYAALHSLPQRAETIADSPVFPALTGGGRGERLAWRGSLPTLLPAAVSVFWVGIILYVLRRYDWQISPLAWFDFACG